MKINSKRIVAFFIIFAILIMPLHVFAIDNGDYIWSSSIETNAPVEESLNNINQEGNHLNLESGAAILFYWIKIYFNEKPKKIYFFLASSISAASPLQSGIDFKTKNAF